jgi:predicted RNase H-like HicB family nuclease
MKYTVIIEAGERNYSAYVPDVPGCVATGTTLEDVERNIREAMAFHLEGMKLEGLPIPEPTTLCAYVEVPDR